MHTLFYDDKGVAFGCVGEMLRTNTFIIRESVAALSADDFKRFTDCATNTLDSIFAILSSILSRFPQVAFRREIL